MSFKGGSAATYRKRDSVSIANPDFISETVVEDELKSIVFLNLQDDGNNNNSAVSSNSYINQLKDTFFSVINILLHSNQRRNVVGGLQGSGGTLEQLKNISAFALVIFEDIQMISWAYSPKLAIPNMPAIIHGLLDLSEYRGAATLVSFEVFAASFTLSLFCAAITILYLIYIGISFSIGSYSYKWTIRFMKQFVVLCASAFFMPIMNALLSPMECSLLAINSKQTLYIVSGLTVSSTQPLRLCFESPNIVLYLLGLLFASVFGPFCLMLNMVLVNTDPGHINPRSRIHGRVSAAHCLLKIILVISWKFGYNQGLNLTPGSANSIICTGLSVIASLILTWLINFYSPNYMNSLNHLRFAIYGTAFSANFVSFLACLILFFNPDGTLAQSSGLAWTLALISSSVITFILMFCFSVYSLRKRISTIESNMQKYEMENNSDERAKLLIFSSWPEPEFLARHYFKYKSKDPDLVIKIFSHATREFPAHGLMHVAYGQYLNVALSLVPLTKVKNYFPIVESLNSLIFGIKSKNQGIRFDFDFQLYCLERMATKKGSAIRRRKIQAIDDQNILDDDDFGSAEYQKEERTVIREHDNVLKYLLKSWKLIANKEYDSRTLTTFSRQIYESAIRAKYLYEKLVRRFPKNAAAYRAYAKYVLEVEGRQLKAHSLLQNGKQVLERKNHAKNVIAIANNDNIIIDSQNEAEKQSVRARLTAKAGKSIRVLKINNIIVMTLTIALNLVNFILVFQSVTQGNVHMEYLRNLHLRDVYTAMIFRGIRMYETEASHANSIALPWIQEVSYSLYTVEAEISKAPDTQATAERRSLYSDSSLEIQYLNNTRKVGMSLFLNDYAKNAQNFVATQGADTEASKFISKNYRNMLKTFRNEITTMYLNPTLASNSTIRSVMIILTIVQLISLILMLYWVDVIVGRFYRTQTKSLNLFRKIPVTLTKSVMIEGLVNGPRIDDLESQIFDKNQSLLISEPERRRQEEEKRVQFRNIDESDDTVHDVFFGVWRFRVRFFVFFSMAIVLYSVFAIYNSFQISSLSRNYVTLNQYGMSMTKGFDASILAQELPLVDDELWTDASQLNKVFFASVLDYKKAFDDVVYGDRGYDPAGYAVNELTEDLKTLMLEKNTCLMLNESKCIETDSRFDDSALYTFATSNRGLISLGREMLILKLDTIRGQCMLSSGDEPQVNDVCDPSGNLLKYLDISSRNDFSNGFRKCMQILVDQSYQDARTVTLVNGVILTGTILMLILGYWYAFDYMIRYLNQRSSQIAEMFIFIPKSVVSQVPEIEKYLQTGDIE